MDFGDQMARAARVARDHPEVGAIERGRFKVVLLDEYQDTSHAQVVLLQRAVRRRPPGDRGRRPVPVDLRLAGRLAPARWTGSRPSSPGPGGRDAWVLNLTRSWRNRPEILRVANALSRAAAGGRRPGRRAGPGAAGGRAAVRRAHGRAARCCPRTPTRPTGSPTRCWPPGGPRPGCRTPLPERHPAGAAADQRGAGPGPQPDPGDRGGAAGPRPAGRGGRPGRPAGHPGGTRRGLHAAGARRPDRRRGAAAAAHRRPLADRPA